MTDQQNYVVAGAHSWNRSVFDEIIKRFPGNWHFIGQTDCPILLYVLDLIVWIVIRAHPRNLK